MYYNRKKELIKSGIIITIILLIALFSTYHIYYKFKGERNVDYDSESLDVMFHEKNGDKITLTRFTPVTDSVGLASTAYTLTITNKLDQDVNYKIRLVDDQTQMIEDNCSDRMIDKKILKVAVKKNDLENEIYILNDLKDNNLVIDTLKGLEKADYVIRVWISSDAPFLNTTNMHYHGIIQVLENDVSLAVR